MTQARLEHKILGSILVNPDFMRIGRDMKLVSPYFSVFNNMLIFMEMERLWEEKRKIDLLSIRRATEKDGIAASYLSSLTDAHLFETKNQFARGVELLKEYSQ
jgi:replicative DNA helicase